LIGIAIHDYVIREMLAEGGMGRVYLAVHPLLSKKVVVKVLLGNYAGHPILRGRFEREARAAAKLGHRYIIDILNFGVLPDGQLFLMMPYLEGRPLDAHLRKHGTKLNIYDTTHIIEQVLVALQHMHEHGMVHRDLKPSNVFITRTEDLGWKVTLIDLGIVRDVAVEASAVKTDTGLSIGTPGYMSPEQYGDAANAGPSADLYAVGIMLWEMLTGSRPWNAPNTNMLFHLQVTTVPELPPGAEMDPEMLALIRKMLERDPNRRPQRARDVGVALASLVPAIPPHVPSGAAILKKVAPEFCKDASPYDGTLRSQGDRERPTPAASSWAPAATHVPALPTSTPRSPFESQPDNAAVAAPTVSQRPAAAFAAPTPPLATPIAPMAQRSGIDSVGESAGSGSSFAAGKTIALGVGCALLVGITTFLIASSRHHNRSAAVPRDASALATDEHVPASNPPHTIDASTTTPTAGSVVAQPDAIPSPPREATVMSPPKHIKQGDHGTTTHRGTEHTQSGGSPVGSAGSASTGSASAGSANTPTSPKKFNPDAIEE
jgi:serine/threonine-protein kinase